jgi:hypothetical protein
MQKTSSKNRLSIQLFLIVLNVTSAAGQTLCETKIVKGEFAYEQSPSIWSEDDMIYRRASLVMVKDNFINYMEGIYTFEYGIDVPEECINKKNLGAVTYYTKSLNDSMHSLLELQETLFLKKNGGVYKLFNLELEVMYLGLRVMKIREEWGFTDREIPCYLILNFNEFEH